MKLSKVQRKDQDRIRAWIDKIQFKENSRSKAAIPDLSVEDVLEKFMPEYDSRLGAYYTPLSMARYLLDYAMLGDYSERIWEPCAGIGNIVYVLKEYGFNNLVATELGSHGAELFPLLFPDVDFKWGDAFDFLPVYEGQFDHVVMNPPFGLSIRLMQSAEYVCKAGGTKSEHLFLELALRAVRPGGSVLAIAPSTWLSNVPKKMQPWVELNVERVDRLGVLPGTFLGTQITVHGYQLWKKISDYVVETQDDIKYEIPEYALEVPSSLFDGLVLLKEKQVDFASVKDVVRSLNSLKYRDAAAWVKENELKWGSAYFYGVHSQNKYLVLGSEL